MRKITLKIAVVIGLVAAAVLGSREPADSLVAWFPILIFAIGAFNVLFEVPGTRWIRAIAVGASFVAFLVPSARGVVVLLFWLFWPPAFLVAWSWSHQPADDESYEYGSSVVERLTPVRVRVAATIGAVAAGTLAYKIIFNQSLEQTAVLFVGIPALLAIVVVLFVSPRSATGVACKAVTVGLLVSLFFLGEGVLCVVLSAPIFYAVAVGVASTMSAIRRTRGDDPTRTVYSSIVVPDDSAFEHGRSDAISLAGPRRERNRHEDRARVAG